MMRIYYFRMAITRHSQMYTVHLDTILKESAPALFTSDNEDFAMPESELMKHLMVILEGYAILGMIIVLISFHFV